ncbi:MAG: PQQ-dependent sugar dehydrogenase [Angustibacter sp.]
MRTPRVTLALALILLVAGCIAEPDNEDRTDPSVSAIPSRSSSSASSPSGAGGTTQVDEATTVTSARDLATDLETPWGTARLGDGSLLVSLRDQARVVQVPSTGGGARAVPATGPDGRVGGVVPGGEGGLLGVAFAPGDTTRLFAYLTSATDNRVVAMPYRDGRLGAPVALLTGIPKAAIHNGGQLAFGPDRMLYVTTGDAGDTATSQDRTSLGGKILRITTTGRAAPGNPTPGSPVWSWGHRNVQGIGWDAQGRMYASEFGQNTWDELNRILPGRNYGWPQVEGRGTATDVRQGFTPPLAQWQPAQASPSGIAVGRGAVWVAALRGERLWRIPLRDDGSIGEPESLLRGRYGRLRTVSLGQDGSMVVATDNVARGRNRPGDDRVVRLTPGR